MGRWGEFPSESDGAHDMIGTVNHAIHPVIDAFCFHDEMGQSSAGKLDFVGVIEMLIDRGFRVKNSHVKLSVDYLGEILEDEDFMNGWRDTQKAKEILEAVKTKMASLLVSDKKGKKNRMDTVLAPRGFVIRPTNEKFSDTTITPNVVVFGMEGEK